MGDRTGGTVAFIGHASEVVPVLARGGYGDVLYVAASATVAEVARERDFITRVLVGCGRRSGPPGRG